MPKFVLHMGIYCWLGGVGGGHRLRCQRTAPHYEGRAITVRTMGEVIQFPRRREPLWRSVLGSRLRRLRQLKGMSLTTTAERAGISAQYLSEIERGRKEPSSEIVAAVAVALGSSVLEVTALAVADLRRSNQMPSGPLAMAA